MPFKVSCILIDKKGKIVATGFNHHAKTGRKMGNPTIHAEVDALSKVKKPSDKLIAFIYRKNARKINPCESCAKLLKAYGIKTVYCSNNTIWELEGEHNDNL
jgi:deoxycytidylate deaminase